jgi:hypothetical protein
MLRAAVLALALLFALPLATSAHHTATHTKCTALVAELNARRSDVRTMYALCIIGRERTQRMASAGTAWHDIGYVQRRLGDFRICYRNVGEAIGYTSATSGIAARFMSLWWASDSHRTMLSASRYDRAGGSWTTSERTYAAMYVVDSC